MVYLGLPIKKGDFPWRTVSHNQMVHCAIRFTPPFCNCQVTRRNSSLRRVEQTHLTGARWTCLKIGNAPEIAVQWEHSLFISEFSKAQFWEQEIAVPWGKGIHVDSQYSDCNFTLTVCKTNQTPSGKTRPHTLEFAHTDSRLDLYLTYSLCI